MVKKLKILILLLIVALVLVGCSKKTIDVNENETDKPEEDLLNNSKEDNIKDNNESDTIKIEEIVTWIGEYEVLEYYSGWIKAEVPMLHGLLAVKKDDKFGFISKEGKEIIPVIYDEIGYRIGPNGGYAYFYEGRTFVKKDEKWACSDKEGNFLTEFIYDDIDIFNEGLAAVKRDGKWGYIDVEGKEIISPSFTNCAYFNEGFAAVTMGDKWGFIDKQGNLVIPFMLTRFLKAWLLLKRMKNAVI